MAAVLSITNPDTVQSLLQDAQDHRSKFFISLPRELTSLTDLSGVLREISARHLTIEVSSLKSDPVTWVTQSLTCYFSVRDKNRKTDIFYNFTGSILDTTHFRGSYNLVLGRPTRLQIGQRRASLRLVPASDDIQGFSIWEETSPVFHCPEVDRPKLHEPLIRWEHPEQRLTAIRNISAGGIRLYLSSKQLRMLRQDPQRNDPLDWTRGTKLVLRLVLADKPAESLQVFWVRGRIRYMHKDVLSRDVECGVEFTHLGIIDQSGTFVWNPVQANIIQELGAWVYQRYLEQFRRGIL